MAMSQGMMLWQLTHCSCVSGPGRWQKGHGVTPSGGSSPLSGLRTISSIFFLYLSGTSGLHGRKQWTDSQRKAEQSPWAAIATTIGA